MLRYFPRVLSLSVSLETWRLIPKLAKAFLERAQGDQVLALVPMPLRLVLTMTYSAVLACFLAPNFGR